MPRTAWPLTRACHPARRAASFSSVRQRRSLINQRQRYLNVTDNQARTGTAEAWLRSSVPPKKSSPVSRRSTRPWWAPARRRSSGTHATKTRGMVSGGAASRKQKAPGRSSGSSVHRSGTTVAPCSVRSRDYSQRTPKKDEGRSLRGKKPDRAVNAGRVAVVDFGVSEALSTKAAVAALPR